MKGKKDTKQKRPQKGTVNRNAFEGTPEKSVVALTTFLLYPLCLPSLPLLSHGSDLVSSRDLVISGF